MPRGSRLRTALLRASAPLLAMLLAGPAAVATPITLDFNGGSGPPSPVVLSGYQVSLNNGNFNPNGFSGGPLYPGAGNAQVTLARVDGGPFNFSQMAVTSGDANQNITFTGTVLGGTQVTSVYNHSGTGAGLIATLPSSFANLTSVTFNQGGAGANSYAFDNLVVESVPEPATTGLLCLAGVAVLRRRRAETGT